MASKYLAVIVSAVIVMIVAAAVYFVLPMFDSDQARLDRHMGRAIAEAEAQLAAYRPGAYLYAANQGRLSRADGEPSSDSTNEKMAKASDAALADAGRILKDALGQQFGELSGADSPEANYLMASVCFHQSTAPRMAAAALRAEALRINTAAIERAAIAKGDLSRATALDQSDPAAAIAELAKQAAELRQRSQKAQAEADTLEVEISKAQAELTPLREQAQQANMQLAMLQAPQTDETSAVDAYAQQYTTLAKAAGQAEYQADAIEFGSLQGAALDWKYGGDPLTDQYVGGTLTVGLETLRRRHDTALAQAEGYANSADAIEARQQAMVTRQADVSRQASEARAKADQEFATLRDLLDQAGRLEAEAESTEDKALTQLTQCKRYLTAMTTAAQSRQRRQTEGDDGTNERIQKIKDDNLPEVQARTAMAEAQLAQAEIYLRRLNSATDRQAVLQVAASALDEIGAAGETNAALDALAVKIDEYRTAGLNSIDTPDSKDDALDNLTKAQQTLSRMRSKQIDSWVIQGQIGQAWYMLALLAGEQELRDQAAAEAVTQFEAVMTAVSGKPEDEEQAKPFAQMLEQAKNIPLLQAQSAAKETDEQAFAAVQALIAAHNKAVQENDLQTLADLYVPETRPVAVAGAEIVAMMRKITAAMGEGSPVAAQFEAGFQAMTSLAFVSAQRPDEDTVVAVVSLGGLAQQPKQFVRRGGRWYFQGDIPADQVETVLPTFQTQRDKLQGLLDAMAQSEVDPQEVMAALNEAATVLQGPSPQP